MEKKISTNGYFRLLIYLRTNKVFYLCRPSTFTAEEEFGNSLPNLGIPSAVNVYSKCLSPPCLILGSRSHNTILYCTVLDPITDDFKVIYFCRIIYKFPRSVKTIRIIGDPDNQRPDK